MKKVFRGFLYSLALLLLAPTASAHVGYLLSEEEFAEQGGTNYEWLLAVFNDPTNIFLILVFLTVAVTAIIALSGAPFIKKVQKNLESKEVDYQRIFPWVIRLSLGIALIGAGTSEYLVNPLITDMPGFALAQVLLGFLLLAGFLLEVVMALAILFFLYALFTDFYLIGSLDFFALAVSFFLIGENRPGVDDLLEIPCYCFVEKAKDLLPLILRVGIGVSMIFLGFYEKVFNPLASAELVERFDLTYIIPVSAEMWVFSAGAIEILVGLLLLLGLYTRLSAAVAFFILSLSFFFFGEDVASHITLFGVLSILFVTGGNKFSLDELIKKKIAKRKKKRKRKTKKKK